MIDWQLPKAERSLPDTSMDTSVLADFLFMVGFYEEKGGCMDGG